MRTLMPIQTRGEKRPLFFVHGEPLKMAQLLKPGYPVYGLSDFYYPHFIPPDTIREHATCYLRELRLVQPRGPYRLLGFSIGGMLAHEIARQLLEQGDEVEYLAMIDPSFPRGRNYRRTAVKKAFEHSTNKLALFGALAKRGFASIRARTILAGRVLLGWSCTMLGISPTPELRRSRNARHNLRAVHTFEYSPLECPATLILADMDEISYQERSGILTGLFPEGRSSLHQIAGAYDHLDMIKEPYISEIAELIQTDLDGLETTDRSASQ